MDASYGSFENQREWFIKRVSEQHFGLRLVLSGHIHRNGLFTAYVAGNDRGAIAGEMLIQSVKLPIIAQVSIKELEGILEKGASGATPPAVAKIPIKQGIGGINYAPGPLYVNTTSAGPRGHLYASKDTDVLIAPRTMQKGKDLYVEPGYALVNLANNGIIQEVIFKSAPIP